MSRAHPYFGQQAFERRARPEMDAVIVPRGRRSLSRRPCGRVVRPASIAEVSACLRQPARDAARRRAILVDRGATPFERSFFRPGLNTLSIAADRIHAGAGVPLQVLQDELAKIGRWLPPVPTYLGAFAGGAVATCAAGAATFKYGTVRDWVDAITVVLAGGDVLKLARGECKAGGDGIFEIETASGVRRVQVPDLAMPDVPKRSAGYFAAPGMDLIDLFIGSEGTLGVITDVTFRTAMRPAAVCRALVPVATEEAAIALVRDLREAARATWRSRDPLGIDLAAIEHIDARSIQVIHEDGVNRKLRSRCLRRSRGVDRP